MRQAKLIIATILAVIVLLILGRIAFAGNNISPSEYVSKVILTTSKTAWESNRNLIRKNSSDECFYELEKWCTSQKFIVKGYKQHIVQDSVINGNGELFTLVTLTSDMGDASYIVLATFEKGICVKYVQEAVSSNIRQPSEWIFPYSIYNEELQLSEKNNA